VLSAFSLPYRRDAPHPRSRRRPTRHCRSFRLESSLPRPSAVTPANSLTIENASGSQYGQTVGLIWWIIGMLLAAVYFIFTYRLFWGKVPAEGEYEA